MKRIYLVLALWLASCSALPALPQEPTPTTLPTITFASRAAHISLYQPLIERFNASNPDMQVQFVALEDVDPSVWQEDGNSARPLVASADTSVGMITPADVEKKYVRDLKPFIDADTAFDWNDYYPRAFQLISTDGGHYVLPQSTYTQVLYYNKSLWQAAGLAEPDPLITWEALLSAAQALAQKDGGNIRVYGLMEGTEGFAPFLHLLDQANINLLGASANSVDLRQQPVIDALEQTHRLIEAGTVHALATSNSTDGTTFTQTHVEQLVLAQRLAIWPANAFAPREDDPRLPFEVGAMLLPPLVQPSTPPAQFGYIMSQGTRYPDQAWRWLSFLSRQSVMHHTTPFDVPARKSVAEQLRFWERLPLDTAAAMQAYVQQPAPAQQTASNIQIWEAVQSQWGDFTAGRVSSANAVSQAQARLDAQLVAQPVSTPLPVVVATPEVIPADVEVISFATPPVIIDADLHAYAKRFTTSNLKIRVQIRSIDDDSSTQALYHTAANYDCFAWAKPLATDAITATLDLKPFIDADTFELADYPPAALARFQSGGKLYGLPHSLQLRVLGYNNALFKARNIAIPEATWTLDQFLDAAQQLTQKSQAGGQYGYGQTFAAPEDVRFFLSQFGASITQEVDGVLQPNYLDPKVLEALQFYSTLLREYSAHDRLPGYAGLDGVPDVLSNGKTGMWLTMSADGYAASLNQNNPLFEPRVTFPPLTHPEKALDDMRVSGLYISAATNEGAACWQWLKFLSEQGALIHPSHNPARISVAESPAYQARALPGAIETYHAYQPLLQQIAAAPPPQLWDDPYFDPYWLYQAIDQAVQGEQIEPALQQAQDITERYLICIRSGGVPAECAARVDRGYKGLGPVG